MSTAAATARAAAFHTTTLRTPSGSPVRVPSLTSAGTAGVLPAGECAPAPSSPACPPSSIPSELPAGARWGRPTGNVVARPQDRTAAAARPQGPAPVRRVGEERPENPAEATQSRAREESPSWTWRPEVAGRLDVMFCRTHSHDEVEADGGALPLYRVSMYSCSCPVGAKGKTCKHIYGYRWHWGALLREQIKADVEAAAAKHRAGAPSAVDARKGADFDA